MALLVLAVVALGALLSSGLYEQLDVEAVAAQVRTAGAWGYAGYLLTFACLQPFGVSAHMFVIAAAVLWPPLPAFVLAMLGALGSATTSFGFARYVAKDWVQSKLPERVRKYEARLVGGGIWSVALVRLVAFTTPPVQLMMGTTRLGFGTMLLGSAIGFTPAIVLDVLIGEHVVTQLLEWMSGG